MIRRVTANMWFKAPRPETVVRAASTLGDVIGWQECKTPAQRAALRKLGKNWQTYSGTGPARHVPISWRSDKYELIDTGWKQVHRAFFGVSVARVILWVVLREKSTGWVSAHLNTHFIAGRQSFPWRRKWWNRHLTMLESRMAWLEKTYGAVVIAGGDFNAQNIKVDGARTVVPSRPTKGTTFIDFFAVRGEVNNTKATVHDIGSDHLAVVSKFSQKEVDPVSINTRVIERARSLGGDVKTRKQWGSKYEGVYQTRRRTKPAKQPADTLVQHITVTFDDGVLVGEFYADMREVERIGYSRFKSGVSYNWCVDMTTGMIGEGQPLDAKGTHTVNDKNKPGYSRDQNYHARAIAVIGMPRDRLTAKGKRGIATIYAAMILEGALTEDPDYLPHSFFAAKDCPSDSTRDAMPEIRRMALAMVKEARSDNNKEDEMNAEQEILLKQTLAAAKRAERFAELSLLRSQVNSRAIVYSRGQNAEDFDKVMEELKQRDAEEAGS